MADDCELPKIERGGVLPSIATILDSLFTVLGVYQLVLDLANTFLSVSLADESQDQFAFTWEAH